MLKYPTTVIFDFFYQFRPLMALTLLAHVLIYKKFLIYKKLKPPPIYECGCCTLFAVL